MIQQSYSWAFKKSTETVSGSVVSDSLQPHRRQPIRLPRPWDSPGKNTGVGCHFLLQCMKVKSQSDVAQSCPTLSDPMDCSLPGSSVHGIFQARGLEWGAIAFSAWLSYWTELILISRALPWFLQVFYLPLSFGSFANFLFITGFSSLWFALFFPSISC